MSQIKRLSSIEREISISINRRVDLAKTALYIAAEDDSLISHSSVALPVDAFVERLDDLSMGFCTNNSSALKSSPEMLLDSLEKFLYVKKVTIFLAIFFLSRCLVLFVLKEALLQVQGLFGTKLFDRLLTVTNPCSLIG